MKKLKSILCITFAFILTAIVLCACGINNKENNRVGTKTTISLAEAERIIVKALAIDNNQLQTQSTRGMVLQAADASEGNRDIFEKLGRFDISQYTYWMNAETNEEQSNFSFTGKALYHNGFEICWMNKSIHGPERYWTNGEQFGLTDPINYKTTEFSEEFTCYQELFEEETFDSIYNDKATKEINKDGYSITLHGDLKSYMLYLHQDWELYQEFIKDYSEYFDKCHFDVTVTVDGNNDAISATVDLVMIDKIDENGTVGLQSNLLRFIKTNEPITEPEWVRNYKLTDEYKNKISNQ